MRTFTIFYSWQSDRDARSCKNFIRIAADDAARRVGERLGVQVLVDADTEGVSGTPPISDTILKKISASDLFLADMTFVGKTEQEKLLPNPNVMGEYGYALKANGFERILLAMNTAFGPPEKLPFDLHHMRHPVQYALEAGTTDSVRRKERAAFSIRLEAAIGRAVEALLKAPDMRVPAPRWDDAQATLAEFVNARAIGLPVLVPPPKLSVWVLPLAALDEPPLTAAAVKSLRPRFAPSSTSRVSEGQDERQWWSNAPPQHVPGKPNPESTWSFRLTRPGYFEVSATIGARIDDDPTIVVNGADIEHLLVSAIDRAADIATELGLTGPALVGAALEGIEDVQMHRSRPGSGGRRIGRPFAALSSVRLGDLAAPAADHLLPMMESMWLIGGWDDGSPFQQDGRWTGSRPT